MPLYPPPPAPVSAGAPAVPTLIPASSTYILADSTQVNFVETIVVNLGGRIRIGLNAVLIQK